MERGLRVLRVRRGCTEDRNNSTSLEDELAFPAQTVAWSTLHALVSRRLKDGRHGSGNSWGGLGGLCDTYFVISGK